MTQETFNFSVDSALLRELGERLVSTVHVAVSELVKNAYDADASEVHVEIDIDEKLDQPTIIVRDNGSGMTLRQIRENWMCIGTTNKEDAPDSPRFGRPRTGSKGVGRFSCRRLGQQLRLVTTAISDASSNMLERTEIDFDWPKFEPGTAVGEVPIEGVVTKVAASETTGTELRISGAPENEWTQRGLQFLSRQLVLLAGNRGARRKGYEEDPGFSVSYKSPDQTEVEDVRDNLIHGAWGTLRAKVGSDGKASFQLDAKGLAGRRTFSPATSFHGINGAVLELGIVPTSHKTRGDLRNPSLFKNYVVAKLTERWGGVQVRYNSFRMYPYGEPNDDWLGIEQDRAVRSGKPRDTELQSFAESLPGVNAQRVLLTMLSNRSYVGQVDVSSRSTALEPRIDRQGFVQSRATDDLKRFVRMAIDWASIYRDDFIRRRSQEDAEDALDEIESLLGDEPNGARGVPTESVARAIRFVQGEVERIAEYVPEAEREETRSRLVKVTSAIETISESNRGQIAHLRTMASASNLTLLFAHEVRSTLSMLGASSARAATIAQKSPEVKNDLMSMVGQIDSARLQLSDLIHLTGIVGDTDPTRTLSDMNLYDAIERTTRCFRLVNDCYGLSIDFSDVPKPLLVGPILDGELFTVLINVTSNAIKSVIARGGQAKKIKFIADETDDGSILRVLDSGIGLDPEHFADAFTPFLADLGGTLYERLRKRANPQDREIFRSGSGLGLAISRDIVRSRGGEVGFINPPDEWSACIEIKLP